VRYNLGMVTYVGNDMSEAFEMVCEREKEKERERERKRERERGGGRKGERERERREGRDLGRSAGARVGGGAVEDEGGVGRLPRAYTAPIPRLNRSCSSQGAGAVQARSSKE
jgi:hypothetical protein